MTVSEASWQQDDVNHRLFDDAYKYRNELLMVNIAIDEKIEWLQSHVQVAGEEALTFQDVDSLKQHVQALLEEGKYRETDSWNDYYRLAMTNSFLTEHILTPYLFSNPRLFNERKVLVNGVAGISVTLLEEVLANYDTHTQRGSATALELKGVVNELTALSLINRAQSPSRIALPASVADDMNGKTDINYWHIRKNATNKLKIQVKSNYAMADHMYHAKGIVVINNQQLQNVNNRFEVARMLVKENDQGLTAEESARLNTLHQQLIEHIEKYTFSGPEGLDLPPAGH